MAERNTAMDIRTRTIMRLVREVAVASGLEPSLDPLTHLRLAADVSEYIYQKLKSGRGTAQPVAQAKVVYDTEDRGPQQVAQHVSQQVETPHAAGQPLNFDRPLQRI